MSFDADAFAAAYAPWTLTISGETFTAHEVSADEVLAFRQRLTAAGTDDAKTRQAVIWFFRLLFPWKLRYWWSGDPVGKILARPAIYQERILQDFSQWEAARRTSLLPPKAHGNGSGNRTGTSSPPKVAPSA